MDVQTWLLFGIVAIIGVMLLLIARRYWEARVNLSEEDEALERRISSLNENQANRRRDDEIVRLLRGDEQPIVGQRRNVDE